MISPGTAARFSCAPNLAERTPSHRRVDQVTQLTGSSRLIVGPARRRPRLGSSRHSANGQGKSWVALAAIKQPVDHLLRAVHKRPAAIRCRERVEGPPSLLKERDDRIELRPRLCHLAARGKGRRQLRHVREGQAPCMRSTMCVSFHVGILVRDLSASCGSAASCCRRCASSRSRACACGPVSSCSTRAKLDITSS